MEKRGDFNLFGAFLGLVGVGLGWYSIATPDAPFLRQILFFGISILLCGIAYSQLYKKNKQIQLLLNTIIGILFGLLMLIESFTSFIQEDLMTKMFSIFILMVGVSEILGSYLKRKSFGGFWILSAFAGILIILSALNSYFNPFSVSVNTGLSIGFDMILVSVVMLLISI